MIMCRLLVSGGGVCGIRVHFDEYKLAGVVLILQNVKAYDSRFLGRVASVLERSFEESLFGTRFGLDKDVDWKRRKYR